MIVIQTNHFKKAVKKLVSKNKTYKTLIDKAINQIMDSPYIGQAKKGDLSSIYVYKFKLEDILYLLAYSIDNQTINLIYLNTHDNYYRDLKRIVN